MKITHKSNTRTMTPEQIAEFKNKVSSDISKGIYRAFADLARDWDGVKVAVLEEWQKEQVNMKTPERTNPSHTPTPWRVDIRPFATGDTTISGGGLHVATVHRDRVTTMVQIHPAVSEAAANANYIVRACNAYEADQRAIARLRKVVEYNTNYLLVLAEIVQGLGNRRGTERSLVDRVEANRVALAETAPEEKP